MYGLTIMSHRYGALAIAILGWQTRFRNMLTVTCICFIIINDDIVGGSSGSDNIHLMVKIFTAIFLHLFI